MSKDYTKIIRDISQYTAEMKKVAPETMNGFYALAKAATADNALDKKTKELIALAIGVTQRCDGCIGFHVKALRDLGTSREELCDVLSMCVYMGGGPALMYAADALRAYDQFEA
ncbi:carboxymuconolactone decarboxylase family protein [Xanthobacter sp. TB0136]|uniref:carboxymuconolactone decarboxylase family protein n=1 Tax=Xanthobacter sp. TB0136 TaxID=3459177 RepID=UPI004039A146